MSTGEDEFNTGGWELKVGLENYHIPGQLIGIFINNIIFP